MVMSPDGDALQGVVSGFALGDNLLELFPTADATAAKSPRTRKKAEPAE